MTPEALAIIISLLSLCGSGFSLYMAYFKRPDLSAYVGPSIVVIYNDRGLTITVPTTIANQSNQVGVVRRCSLTLNKADSTNDNFYMVWHHFRKISNDGATWIQAETAHALPVIGRSTKTANVEYIWDYRSSPKLSLSSGSYRLRFDFWSEADLPFATVEHDLTVSDEEANRLNESFSQRDSNQSIRRGVVYLSLDSETNKNRVMTKHEMTRLLSD
ncbi:hypothetical protein [Ruficoccus sp. ZRK36]|uniref:hypothetical protein n=1 Tax=Ruficoccus sp. ZRK36 TaxID=2866311 RepID=UPI001C731798|nr:hypothetical protein [Ruficoccus sp. ZRK36]QYY36167.1 hypothetical protein K0V07_01550 [Ruficoccus sp. ZRK36]